MSPAVRQDVKPYERSLHARHLESLGPEGKSARLRGHDDTSPANVVNLSLTDLDHAYLQACPQAGMKECRHEDDRGHQPEGR